MWPIYLIIGLIISFFLCVFIIGYWLSAPAYKGPVTDHFDGKKFINPGGVEAKGFKDIFKWMREGRSPREWKEDLTPPVHQKLKESKNGECTITFINHSTFLIQMDGLHILTDPVWSKYASPFQFTGPKRMKQPGLNINSLVKVDYVLLSHNHYDHLDLKALKQLERLYSPEFITALGVDLFLINKGIRNVKSIDWWQNIQLQQINLCGTPAQHFSSRGLFDRNRTLWCGFTLKSKNYNIYYVGDSGYGPFFQEIGDRLGPFDASIIPIGAFKPEWFMQPIHVNPTQALQIHADVKSKRSIACHFGTFPLADDNMDEPEKLLQQGLKLNGFKNGDFVSLGNGQQISIP
jgi:L-ascorbate metabolism protein UlaG (beta-lactamase superfamily)